jgi:hypothetical protein
VLSSRMRATPLLLAALLTATPARADDADVGPPIVVITVGGAGLLVGMASAAIAISASDELDASCRASCRDKESLREDVDAFTTAAAVGLAGGGAVFLAGVVWLAVVKSDDDVAVTPWTDGEQVGIAVSF